MKRILFFCFFLASFLTGFAASDLEIFAEGNNAFALKYIYLLCKFDSRKNPVENFVFSPLGARDALVLQAFADSAATEDRRKLFIPENFVSLAAKYCELMDTRNYDNVKFGRAVRVWADKKFVYSEGFMKLCKSLNAEYCSVLFSNRSVLVNDIEQWLSDADPEGAKYNVSADLFSAEDELAIFSSCVFVAKWEQKFNSSLTKKNAFFISEGKYLLVDMMNCKSAQFRFAKTENFEAARMDYKGKFFSMTFVKPVSEKRFNPDILTPVEFAKISDALAAFSEFQSENSIDIPRLSIKTHGINLLSAVQSDGIFKRAVSGIFEGEANQFSKILQECSIDVNEDGTSARSVTMTTALGMSTSSRPVPYRFAADSPFMFFITDNSSGAIIFAGCVSNPNSMDFPVNDEFSPFFLSDGSRPSPDIGMRHMSKSFSESLKKQYSPPPNN